MSTLFVDTINEKTTNNGVQISGHIVQVVTTYVEDSAVIETSSTSFVASGITASITPKASGNIILVDMFIGMADSVSDTMNTQMHQLIAGGSYSTMAGGGAYHMGIQSTTNRYSPLVFGGKYTTTSTSQLTYQPYFKATSSSTVRLVHVNSSYALTLMEIAQ